MISSGCTGQKKGMDKYMKNVLLHTPEGVRDIYNRECERKLYLNQKIHNVLKNYGYSDIETPTFEFFDIFSKEKGTVESRKMYKFFDREGNTLVLKLEQPTEESILIRFAREAWYQVNLVNSAGVPAIPFETRC